jgi:hypothetical protein
MIFSVANYRTTFIKHKQMESKNVGQARLAAKHNNFKGMDKTLIATRF